MAQVTLTVALTLDGVPVAGFPLSRTLSADEVQAFGPVERDGDGNTTSYGTLPVDSIATLQGLVVAVDRPVNIRLNGQSTGAIALQGGGVLILLGANLTAGATTNATANNPAAVGVPAALRGIGVGT